MPANLQLSDTTVTAADGPAGSGALPHSDLPNRPASLRPQPPPANLSGYEILDQLGEGATGTVWRARQLGTRQLIALKLLRTEHLTAAGCARFVREVEILARLRHPHIARIYDSGVHQNAYFYVMELIDGPRLDQFVQRRSLGQRQILELMGAICSAVGFAHQNGVIHRDLKPSNILVSSEGQPHVVDFGLAKAVLGPEEPEAVPSPEPRPPSGHPSGSKGASDTTYTAEGVAAGTVAYMSPEQAAGRIRQIDTRCDVYSLGKVLFQLLTGHPAHELRGLSESEQLKRVAETEVRCPRQLDPRVDNELESLLLKALSRDPDRRYASATELARDLANYLAGEPLAARPWSFSYILRKWVAKRRLRVIAAAAAMAVLFGTAAYSHWRVLAAHHRAEQARDEAESLSTYLEDLLKSADPRNSGGREVTVRDILARVDKDVSVRFASKPAVEARVRHTAGQVLLSLGAFREAESQCARAVTLRAVLLGPEHPLALAAMEHHARACRELGRFALAQRLCREVLSARQKNVGPAHPDALRAANTLACTLNDLGRGAEALALIDQALLACGKTDIDPSDPEPLVVDLIATRALVLRNDPATLARAESLCESVLAARRTLAQRRTPLKDPRLDPDVLEAMHDLALVMGLAAGADPQRLSRSDALFSQTIDLGVQVLGEHHADVLIWKCGHADALWRLGNVARAQQLLADVLPASDLLRDRSHPYNVTIRNSLARLCRERRQWQDAERYFRELVEVLEQHREPDDPERLRCSEELASLLSARGDTSASADLYRKVFETRRSSPSWGPRHVQTLRSAHHLASVLLDRGDPISAQAALRDALSAANELAHGQPRELLKQLQHLIKSLESKE